MRANYKVEISSGIFLLLGIAALVWLATTATNFGRDIGKDTYSITARFQNVGDLRHRAPVKIGGVTVGQVESISLDPVSLEAVVKMYISSSFNEIPSDTGALILTSGMLGNRYIGLEPGGAPDVLEDGDEVSVESGGNSLEAVLRVVPGAAVGTALLF